MSDFIVLIMQNDLTLQSYIVNVIIALKYQLENKKTSLFNPSAMEKNHIYSLNLYKYFVLKQTRTCLTRSCMRSSLSDSFLLHQSNAIVQFPINKILYNKVMSLEVLNSKILNSSSVKHS